MLLVLKIKEAAVGLAIQFYTGRGTTTVKEILHSKVKDVLLDLQGVTTAYSLYQVFFRQKSTPKLFSPSLLSRTYAQILRRLSGGK